MKKGFTELVFILDRSGSMHGLEVDTIGGFNSMLDKQKKVDGECRITTVLFDNQYKLLHDRIDIHAIRPMNENDYCVGGSTALLDALGKTITKLVNIQKNTAQPYQAEHVLFVIITDGEENASREYSIDQIKKMIEHQQKQYGWEFIFLGANIDAVAAANNLGIAADHAAEYVADECGTELNFQAMSQTVARFRQCGCVDSSPMEAIRQDAKSRGKKTEKKQTRIRAIFHT